MLVLFLIFVGLFIFATSVSWAFLAIAPKASHR
jgi:hypothetical protein